MSHEENELHQAQAKVIQMEAMERLMGSSAYQDQIQPVERELGGGGTPAGMCKKCSGQVHPSGVNKCSFHNMSYADAEKQLGQLMTAVAKLTLEKLLELVKNIGE